jgi:diguanylate cyclase (GGDEF)-like protein
VGGRRPDDAKERLLEALLRSSQYGLMLLDDRLRVLWVSDAGAAALRYEPQAIIGKQSGELLDDAQDPGVIEAISEVVSRRADESAPGWQLGVRVRLRCGDGVPRDFEFGGRTILGGGATELMLVFVDVSDRARLEDVLTAVTQHDLPRALERFLALASSQLRSPVGIALQPSLGGATYATAGFRDELFAALGEAADGARTTAISSPLGAVFGWFVIDREDLTPWSVETVERLTSLLGLVLSNQAMFSDLVDAAATDPLTGLSNRRVLDVALVGAETSATLGWAVLYLDLDGFKSINDRWGHDAGDVVLRVVAERLQHALRSGDVVARVGGDEFVVLAQADLEQAAQLVDRVRAALDEPVHDGDARYDVGVSIGTSTATTAEGARALLAEADAAMRREKAARRAAR